MNDEDLLLLLFFFFFFSGLNLERSGEGREREINHKVGPVRSHDFAPVFWKRTIPLSLSLSLSFSLSERRILIFQQIVIFRSIFVGF